MSDRVSSFGIFEINSEKDLNNQTSHLISQVIWYFLEGFSLRIGDFPSKKSISKNFKKYVVPLDQEDFQFIFYKSKLSGRWWISSITSIGKLFLNVHLFIGKIPGCKKDHGKYRFVFISNISLLNSLASPKT